MLVSSLSFEGSNSLLQRACAVIDEITRFQCPVLSHTGTILPLAIQFLNLPCRGGGALFEVEKHSLGHCANWLQKPHGSQHLCTGGAML
jgi:hypothetical protein